MARHGYLLLSLFILLARYSTAQKALYLLESPTPSYYQDIATFSNGDILVGDKKISESGINTRNFFLTRIDSCGQEVWSYEYGVLGKTLTFVDMAISDDDEIYVTGEFVVSSVMSDGYIMKLDSNGDLVRCISYDGFVKEHPYDLSLGGGRVMVGGLVFDQPNTDRQYFTLTFDENLDQISAYGYAPFDTYGPMTMTSDFGAVIHTGNKVIKSNADGSVAWAKEFDRSAFWGDFISPLETSDGIVLGLKAQQTALLLKLDANGILRYQSNAIAAYGISAQVVDDRIHVINTSFVGHDGLLSHTQWSSELELVKSRFLQTTEELGISRALLSMPDKTTLNLFGHGRTPTNDRIYYLGQFDIRDEEGNCAYWEPFTEFMPSSFDFQMTDFDVTSKSLEFSFKDHNIRRIQLSQSLTEFCVLEKRVEEKLIDTLIECEAQWSVSPPHRDFIWDDGNIDNPRLLVEPGTYIARQKDCGTIRTYTYHLEKSPCACSYYVPTAISPNNDGINDELAIFSNCQVDNASYKLYDRWGGKLVYERNNTLVPSDGKAQELPAGVYVMDVTFDLIDALGEVRQVSTTQELVIIK